MKILYLIVIAFIVSIQSYAQDEQFVFDSKGTDFWLAFPPNYHQSQFSDSLYIFIVADTHTVGVIEYRNRFGTYFYEPFTINNADDIFKFSMSYVDFEVYGYNIRADIYDQSSFLNQSEKKGVNSFHVMTDNEVTVYAHTQAYKTSDAFLVLPTDVLGKEYLILAYNSDGEWQSFNNSETGSSTPSQFLIVASQDSTNVTINPSTALHVNGNKQLKVKLDQGDVFLVQARISSFDLRPDLTGTEVLTDKPIAIFSGQQRALVPITTSMESRDILVEQLQPVPTWGRNAYVIPYAIPSDAINQGMDLYRILVGQNGTEVFINGNSEGVWNRGEFIEKTIGANSAYTINATGPILVAEYRATAQYSGFGDEKNGDPFLMLVPPKEQFMKEYNVINNQTYELNGMGGVEGVYNEHYISIVAPKIAISSIQIDGNYLNSNNFIAIPQSDYFYTNKKVFAGAHKVESPYEFGIYIYGYGYANSYGYTGGLRMTIFDYKKPQVQAKDSCFSLTGLAFATNKTINKLRSVEAAENKKVNVKVNIEPYKLYQDTVKFNANLINKYFDGSFVISAKDSVGQDSTVLYEIPGFTVALDSSGTETNIKYFNGRYRTKGEHCEYFNLTNYGKFNHDISIMNFNNSNSFSMNLKPRFAISSKEKLPLEICFSSDSEAVFIDTLTVGEECTSREILALRLEFKHDKIPPTKQLTYDKCMTNVNIVFSDTTFFDWGLKSVNILDTFNCRISTPKQGNNIVNYLIEVIDPFKDAYFNITAEDSVGNITTVADTIQGFTLALSNINNQDGLINFDKSRIGTNECDTLNLTNTGILPFHIDNIFVKNNIHFSIPSVQLPLDILPGETVSVEVCFLPLNTNEIFSDSLFIVHNCRSLGMTLEGLGEQMDFNGESDCGIKIIGVANDIAPGYFIEQSYPNPVIGKAQFNFGLTEPGNVNLKIYDLLGNQQVQVFDKYLKNGIYGIEANLSDLTQGSYIYVLSYPTGNMSGRMVKY